MCKQKLISNKFDLKQAIRVLHSREREKEGERERGRERERERCRICPELFLF
jgi:hypothetical protein